MTEAEETRYQRSVRIQHERDRHARIVGKLIKPIETEWELAVEAEDPLCARGELPSRWIDWDSEPGHREFYEGNIPTAEEAKSLCEGCPIMRARLCERYADATNQAHGVWGGKRRENGKWVK
jgi:hypothetical protein